MLWSVGIKICALVTQNVSNTLRHSIHWNLDVAWGKRLQHKGYSNKKKLYTLHEYIFEFPDICAILWYFREINSYNYFFYLGCSEKNYWTKSTTNNSITGQMNSHCLTLLYFFVVYFHLFLVYLIFIKLPFFLLMTHFKCAALSS